jgi:ABC-type glycerol-3-phosphate transport system permease component
MAPIVVGFSFLQRFLIRGMLAGTVKYQMDRISQQ